MGTSQSLLTSPTKRAEGQRVAEVAVVALIEHLTERLIPDVDSVLSHHVTLPVGLGREGHHAFHAFERLVAFRKLKYFGQ